MGDIRRIYHKLIAWNLYSGSVPTDGLKMPRVDNARIRYLTPDEAERLLDALKQRSLNWWRMAMISMHSGMRIGEILALRGSDIDLSAKVVHHVVVSTDVTCSGHSAATLEVVCSGTR